MSHLDRMSTSAHGVNGENGLVYASTACLGGHEPLMERLECYRKAGIQAVELGAGIKLSQGTANALEWLRNWSDSLLLHNYFPPPEKPFVLNLASANASIRQQSRALVREALRWCKVLGIPFYSVHAGFVTDPAIEPGGVFVFPDHVLASEASEAFERYVRNLKALLVDAQSIGVPLLVENNVCPPALVGKLLLQRPDEFTELADQLIGHEWGILLDTGHLKVSARTFDFDLQDFLDEAGSYIRAFHVHTNDGSADQHRPIAENGPVAQLLAHPRYCALPAVVEARFDSAEALSAHVKALTARRRAATSKESFI